jgi:AraC-like DNA-binding protein
MQPKSDAPRLLVLSEQALELKQTLENYQGRVKVLCAMAADDGLSLLSGRSVDLVILHLHSDWQPDIEVLRHIRMFFPYLPVVILAECSTLAGAESCAGLSTQGYLRMPASGGELWRAIDKALFVYPCGELPGGAKGARRKEVAQALSTIHARHHEGISAQKVARKVNMSRNHLGSLFKAEMDRTLSEYINLCRVATAMRIISREADLGFGQVAGRAGFSSESYLSKVFKRLLDMTPKSFRQKIIAKGPAASAWCETLIHGMFQRGDKHT